MVGIVNPPSLPVQADADLPDDGEVLPEPLLGFEDLVLGLVGAEPPDKLDG